MLLRMENVLLNLHFCLWITIWPPIANYQWRILFWMFCRFVLLSNWGLWVPCLGKRELFQCPTGVFEYLAWGRDSLSNVQLGSLSTLPGEERACPVSNWGLWVPCLRKRQLVQLGSLSTLLGEESLSNVQQGSLSTLLGEERACPMSNWGLWVPCLGKKELPQGPTGVFEYIAWGRESFPKVYNHTVELHKWKRELRWGILTRKWCLKSHENQHFSHIVDISRLDSRFEFSFVLGNVKKNLLKFDFHVIVCRLSFRHRVQNAVTDCYCLPSLLPAPSAECGY